ncbi:MAG: LAGLIDADG family homing endonuclease [Actinomycetota bacterium]
MSSDNATGADNQQERLDDYLAGYVDGEGSFHVAIQRNPSTKFGWQLVPEFHVSQNPERASILTLLQSHLGCGRIRPNARTGGRDKALVYVVRNRRDLLEKVIPFFETHPILSEKRLEFEIFASIVRAMARGEHLTQDGFFRLLYQATHMNGGGKYRKYDWSSRILRDHMPDAAIVQTEKLW